MNLHQFQLISFAAGAAIHAVSAVLVWRLLRETTGCDRSAAREGLAICVLTFFWQFGNLWRHMALMLEAGSLWFTIGDIISTLSLVSFPLLFSYMIDPPNGESRLSSILANAGRWLRYPLWAFVPVAAVSTTLSALGQHSFFDPGLALTLTLNMMMAYFILFMVLGILQARRARASGGLHLRAIRVSTIASFIAAATFLVMLWSPGLAGRYAGWVQLAAMMTSVPFTLAVAYRLYQFSFMDVFLREVLTGLTLLVAFCSALKWAPANEGLKPLWLVATAMLLAFAKEPLSHWIDRKFLGYQESIEDQEERIGSSIRGLTQLSDFAARASEILGQEIGATWVTIAPEAKPGAIARFQIPGSTPMWLSLGPRNNGRSFMSRQQRLARTAALELAAQHERLTRDAAEVSQLVQQHELRETTARAQMQALQAQINPHFLFNTLNVLASLIHTNPAKAELVTEDLAEIFRYALESTRRQWVPLDDELRFLESYLEIEKARFGERLQYTFEVDAAVRSRLIPPMILQPLVENAVRHGISPKLGGGQIRIVVRIEHDRLLIDVEDTGVGMNHKGTGGSGIGLNNVRDRLAHVYGVAGVIRMEPMSPEGTRVALELPQHHEVQA